MLVWFFICFCAHTFREVMISSRVFNHSVTYYRKQIIFIKSQRKTRGEEGEIKFGESINTWNSGCKCVAALHHPSLQQHVREAAEKPFACTRLEQRWHGSQERNVVRATSERAQQNAPVLRGPPVCIQPHHHLPLLPSPLELNLAQRSHYLTIRETDRQLSITPFCKEHFRVARSLSCRHTSTCHGTDATWRMAVWVSPQPMWSDC